MLKESVKATGLTLVELMITLGVAAVLLAVAVPSFQALVESNGLTNHINLFVTALNLAPRGAMKRGKTITLCKSDDANDCGATGYEQDWIVFVETDNGDGARTPLTEELLRINGSLKTGYTLRGNQNFSNYLSYKPSGAGKNAVGGHFILCKDKWHHEIPRGYCIGNRPRTGGAWHKWRRHSQ
jgi:type IV fimbrial biogenesis protein FimT